MSIDTNIKILLVEDSKVARKMQVKVLGELGFNNVITAEDGQDALDKLQQEEGIELIISDWNMPNKDGYELLCQVRANEESKEIPFIMATARGEKKQAAAAVEAGVSNFITKPFSPVELKELIDETLTQTEAGPDSVPSVGIPRLGSSGKLLLNIAHIQITDHLTLGVLKELIATGKLTPQHFELETTCMPSWNSVQSALEKGKVEGAFVLAPIAMDLFNYKTPIKLVLFAHKNGSISVRKSVDGHKEEVKSFFKGKTFYIPHEMSIHHMLSHMFLREIGLTPGFFGRGDFDTQFEVVPPVKMPEFLAANSEVAGFLVAEPLGTKAIAEGIADMLFLSGELWENHPCCVVTMRDEVIEQYEDAIQEFVNMLIEAGKFISEKPETAAEIGVSFLDPNKAVGLKVPVLKNVLKEAQGIKTDDLYPVKEDLERIQQYMVNEIGVGSLIDIDRFVDTRFADAAYKGSGAIRKKSTLKSMKEVVSQIVRRQSTGVLSKSMLNKEGKYLIFGLDTQEYGIDILFVKEIIGMKPIRQMPHTPEFIMGLLNLRGKVFPVIDLRTKLGIHKRDNDDKARIIVLEVLRDTGIAQLGMVVDSVSDVVDIKAEHIDDVSSYQLSDLNMGFILAMAKMNGSIKMLLNTEQLFVGV